MKPILIVIFAIAIALVDPKATRADGIVNSNKISVRLPTVRVQLLKSIATTLMRNHVPGYAAIYASPTEKGTTLVAAVNQSNVKKWFNTVGKESIGFACSMDPHTKKGSAFVRVGETLYYFRAVRGGEDHHGSPCVPVDIREKKGRLTEATYPVTPTEMKAISAFFKARNLNLIKDDNGQIIKPTYKMMSPSGKTFTNENCALACTSVINPIWLQAFEKNIPTLRSYGKVNNIPELKSASPEMIHVLQKFGERTAGVQVGRKSLIRTNFLKAPLLTLFNAEEVDQNPIQEISWKGYGWQGLTTPKVLFDRGPNENPSKEFKGSRISIDQLLVLLD